MSSFDTLFWTILICCISLSLGPCLGPIVGGWVGECIGWRWIYWVLFIMLGCAFVLTLFVPETLAPVLLRQKAEKLRKETGDETIKSLGEMNTTTLIEKLRVAISRPIIMMFREPIILFMSFCELCSCSIASLFS